jgi:glycine cleavage system H lipoate-binding protein
MLGKSRLFCPRLHTWLLPLVGSRYRLGLTQRGWDEIGDVIESRTLVSLQQAVVADQPLLELEWEALAFPEGEAPSPRVWSNWANVVEGVATVRTPVAATVLALNAEGEAEHGDPDLWLVELALRDASLADAKLLDESGYRKALAASPRGRFAE